MNGYIAFNHSYLNFNPSPLPLPGNPVIIAPLWIDMDGSFFDGKRKDNTKHNDLGLSNVRNYQTKCSWLQSYN